MTQLSDIKEKLIEQPEKIIELLETFDFCHINLRPHEIRFARDMSAGQNIRIRLQKNDWVNVDDYSRAVRADIFSYIMQEKNVTFLDVLKQTKQILGLNDYWQPKAKKSIFGGIYERIYKQNAYEIKTYDECVLSEYQRRGNLRFLKDHISLETQKKFCLSYDVMTQRILIPIRDIFGSLCGIKARRNYETDDPDDPKYLYSLPCPKSLLLYGAHENYEHLMNADRIVIGEAEKFVLACDSYGYHSAVSIMGSVLCPEQAKTLLGFNAKEYCFMLDEGLDPQVVFRNAELLKSFAAMREVKITYFDWRDSLSVGEKESPTDGGKENFYYILENEIKELQTEEDDEI